MLLLFLVGFLVLFVPVAVATVAHGCREQERQAQLREKQRRRGIDHYWL